VNRDDLDAFFAKADDVLDNWHGSDDAMHAKVPTDEDAEALPGDSYYEQAAGPIAGGSLPPLIVDIELDLSAWNRALGHALGQTIWFGHVPVLRGPSPDRVIFDEWVEGERWDAALDPRERALQLRRNRNTGPADRRRLDGRATRSGARS